MEYTTLGTSDLKVSVIAFGAWQIGDASFWGESNEKEAEQVVNYAIEEGINLFDTAEMYGSGESEIRLGTILNNHKRSQVIIATKVSPQNCHPDLLIQSCENSLKRLNTDYIDLYQIHWPPKDIPFSDVYETMNKLKEQGKIRYIGVSNFGKEDLQNWFDCGGVSISNQIGYNLLFRAPEYEIIPYSIKHNIGILVYMPLMQGLLAGRWQKVEDIPILRRRTRHFSKNRPGTRHGEEGCERLTLETIQAIHALSEHLRIPMATLSLSWLHWQKGVSSIIVGCRSKQQLESNIKALLTPLDPEVFALLNEITYPLKRYMGTNADMWENENNKRIH
ncbi:MAG TPA: aldo/keto reductase [Candidatus Hydrogenedens sp.]|nr:aldo/keto reductase [Candidatus Hydrogenedens sp.]HOK08945.1 aldo/keto reductase [Candidatus Hydrogenedens sp.]HOL19726.1 aldo/keto reductase [Candidatus Hydrogenedens sp.]HPP58749.1 aldo/keto reductase [Candidatus Hydrogenedens sp.]